MTINWRSWCRMCAASQDLFSKMDSIAEYSTSVQKHFFIKLSETDGKPSTICSDCVQFVINMDTFAIRCAKVDKLFDELIIMDEKYLNNSDINSVRTKYGLQMLEDVPSPSTETIEGKPQNIKQECGDDSYLFVDVFEQSQTIESEMQHKELSKTSKLKTAESVQKISVHKSKLAKIIKVKQRQNDSETIKTETQHNKELSKTSKLKTAESVQKICGNKSKLTKNVKRTNDSEKCCLICGSIFQRIHQYRYHMRMKHTEKPAPIECLECHKYLNNKNALRKHQLCHLPDAQRRMYTCDMCPNKSFTSKNGVRIHMHIAHTGERQFICEQCGRSFITPGALRRHTLSHTDERPYSCQFCSKCFKTCLSQKRHEESHSSSAENECSHCGLKLKTKETLRRHMMVHSERKEFKCTFCGNEYKRWKTLKSHLILHTGERPYKCPFCAKSFANGSNFRSHKKKEHPLELVALEAIETNHATLV